MSGSRSDRAAASVARQGLGLDEQLCFALYAASRAATGHYRVLLADLDLTYPQYLVMLVLWEDPGAARTVSEIGDRVQLESGTLSPLLQRLERHGLVQRRRRTDDERAVDVLLTDAGRVMRERAVDVPCRMTQAMGLDPDSLASLRTTLLALADRLGDAGNGSS